MAPTLSRKLYLRGQIIYNFERGLYVSFQYAFSFYSVLAEVKTFASALYTLTLYDPFDPPKSQKPSPGDMKLTILVEGYLICIMERFTMNSLSLSNMRKKRRIFSKNSQF